VFLITWIKYKYSFLHVLQIQSQLSSISHVGVGKLFVRIHIGFYDTLKYILSKSLMIYLTEDDTRSLLESIQKIRKDSTNFFGENKFFLVWFHKSSLDL